jgi:hypothetical protein
MQAGEKKRAYGVSGWKPEGNGRLYVDSVFGYFKLNRKGNKMGGLLLNSSGTG